ncbi:hypothetical protein [Acidicapsa acidisoli]|uniref:hypothetical protein n=1 Tax=Acidicapsa acidisoli TaxID=1615681 RepID=UPI0021E06C2E|nr:hypothetical protein [Acidicapsa acidisoli]
MSSTILRPAVACICRPAFFLRLGLAALLASGLASAQAQDSFFARYQARVSATQAEQPHWITPLVTVTPRLEQEFRTDFLRQYNGAGYATWLYDNSKGLEIIPARRIELLFNLPPYETHDAPGDKSGWGDVSFNSKFRFFARNEEHGNAIVTGFFAATLPTSQSGNGSCCAVVTPTLAVGKGWGLFDLTSTAGGSLPVTNSKGLGHTITWNNVAQYRLASTGVARLFWPEVESNTSFFKGGSSDGKTTSYVTPGLIIGRVPLTHDASGKPGRLGLTFGAGEEIAVTHFHSQNHLLVFTARMPF